jgi:hypothetical protein
VAKSSRFSIIHNPYHAHNQPRGGEIYCFPAQKPQAAVVHVTGRAYEHAEHYRPQRASQAAFHWFEPCEHWHFELLHFHLDDGGENQVFPDMDAAP